MADEYRVEDTLRARLPASAHEHHTPVPINVALLRGVVGEIDRLRVALDVATKRAEEAEAKAAHALEMQARACALLADAESLLDVASERDEALAEVERLRAAVEGDVVRATVGGNVMQEPIGPCTRVLLEGIKDELDRLRAAGDALRARLREDGGLDCGDCGAPSEDGVTDHRSGCAVLAWDRARGAR